VRRRRSIHPAILIFLLGAAFSSAGCGTLGIRPLRLPSQPVPSECMAVDMVGCPPRELCKAVLPMYTVEPPDILVIDAVRVVPKAPYALRTLDAVALHVSGVLDDAPIDGNFQVEPGGLIRLVVPEYLDDGQGVRQRVGMFDYGVVKVAGLTPDEARFAIERQIRKTYPQASALVTLAEIAAKQQIAGEHLVGPDGTVTLGSYGSVMVVGMTLAEAKRTIEDHLAQYLDEPEVSVDVFAYNSRVYYVITQGAGMGDGVFRFPVTGNETVLDAISQITGLEQVSSKKIWLARAGRNSEGCHQILPVDWNAITQCGDIETNYQVLPGDRVYVAEDKLIAFDVNLAKFIAPLERIMGFTLLGAQTASRLSGSVLRGGGMRGFYGNY
jgi:polysaccharide export outer membrane protein